MVKIYVMLPEVKMNPPGTLCLAMMRHLNAEISPCRRKQRDFLSLQISEQSDNDKKKKIVPEIEQIIIFTGN